MQPPLGSLPVLGVFSPAGSEDLEAFFFFYCLVSFVLLNKTRAIADPGAEVKKKPTSKGSMWRTFMTRLVFRAWGV